MNKSIDLRNDPIKKLFGHYLYASVIGMVIKSIHIMLDGIFVSNGVAPEALAAVNIFMPVVTAAIAVTLALSAGGSTLCSMYFGEGKDDNAQNIFIVSTALIFLTGIVFSAIFLINPERVCILLGANDDVINHAIEYGRYICYSLPFYTLATGVALYVRNDKNPKLSMISTVAGAVVNAILNYIFIFTLNMGLKGAALATGIAQIVACIILVFHFIQKKGNFRLTLKGFSFRNGETLKTLKIGFPSFLADMSYAIVSIIFNKVIMKLGGANAVWAFTTMIYISTFLYNLYYGVGQGIQPIISFNYGAKCYKRVYECFHIAIKYSVLSAFILGGLCIVFTRQIVMLFSSTKPELIEMGVQANIYIFFLMPIIAYNIIVITYLQSVGFSIAASTLSILRGIVFIILFIIILTKLFGLFGIWLVYPVSEAFSAIVSIIFMKKQDIFDKIF